MNTAPVRRLAAKELRHLLPLVTAIGVLELLALFEALVIRSPDTMSWYELSILFNQDTSGLASTIMLLVGAIAGFMLFPHEQDNRTLPLLWALPIRRHTVFATKVLTAAGLLAALTFTSYLISWWLQSFAVGTAAKAQFSWQLWWLELALSIGAQWIGLGYGLFASWFRLGGMLGLAVLWAAVSLIALLNPGLALLDPSNLFSPEFRGTEILLPISTWQLHGVASAVSLGLAGWLWTRRSTARADGPSLTERLGALPLAALVLSATVGVLIYNASRTVSLDDGALRAAEPRSLTTRYFRLDFVPADQARAELLAIDADRLFEAVVDRLGAPPAELIVADLTDTSDNHLGIAGWKRLRMSRSSLYDREEREHVFVHEASHVLADHLADRRLGEQGLKTAFFNEGLAEWISYDILGLPEQKAALLDLAAAAWQRFDLSFRHLASAGTLQAAFDANLVYALGLAWNEALITTCGRTAPSAVLRAMGRPDASQRVGIRLFWEDVLTAADCSLGAVNARLARDLEARDVTRIPSVVADARQRDSGEIAVSVTIAGAETAERSYPVRLQVRDSAGVPQSRYYRRSAETTPGSNTVTFSVPAHAVSGERFQYQAGVVFEDGQRPFYGRWLTGG